MTIFVDRSNVNGTDDYAKAPVSHAYFKATEGTGFTDATYVQRRDAAHKAGAVVGAYHFADTGDPVAEADHFLAAIGTPKADGKHFKPCLDLERGQTAGWAEAFVKHVESHLGYLPVLYGNTSQISVVRAASVTLRACPWWRAEYGVNDGTRHTLAGGDQGAAAHQYTSVASVPGIDGHTDQSVFLSTAGEASMIVKSVAPAKKWPKPDHWGLDYIDVAGKPQHVKTRHPGLWQARHRKARDRGPLTTTPVFHPIKK